MKGKKNPRIHSFLVSYHHYQFYLISYPPIYTYANYRHTHQDYLQQVSGAEALWQAAMVIIIVLSEYTIEATNIALGTACVASLNTPLSPSTPLVDNPASLHQLWGLLGESGPTQSHEFLPERVFSGTPISQLSKTPPVDTAGSMAETPAIPVYFPPKGLKLKPCKALSIKNELSIVNIYNTFHC